MQFPKPKTYRNKKHLEYIKTLPCHICGKLGPSAPHHVSLRNTGMGMKPPDDQTVPLCQECHNAVHAGVIVKRVLEQVLGEYKPKEKP